MFLYFFLLSSRKFCTAMQFALCEGKGYMNLLRRNSKRHCTVHHVRFLLYALMESMSSTPPPLTITGNAAQVRSKCDMSLRCDHNVTLPILTNTETINIEIGRDHSADISLHCMLIILFEDGISFKLQLEWKIWKRICMSAKNSSNKTKNHSFLTVYIWKIGGFRFVNLFSSFIQKAFPMQHLWVKSKGRYNK